MSLSRETILEYALRYVEKSNIVDFPLKNDLFCFLFRTVPENKVLKDDEGWGFGGYGYLIDYELDLEEKPLGKWIWMKFIDLSVFPPTEQIMKLQPPHIAQGLFQNPARTHETKIFKIETNKKLSFHHKEENKSQLKNKDKQKKSSKNKILNFKPKSSTPEN